ncbi:unnamed protein product [Cylicocyclus nassatus]|uniref:SCP domain-containing protein n=1 Tax=Cylicocyclus nassatus TaxID=53992 RepID=A0AA36M4T0_CYLNA|nr:unnamed protein product [Cylicocyclus nassatus]
MAIAAICVAVLSLCISDSLVVSRELLPWELWTTRKTTAYQPYQPRTKAPKTLRPPHNWDWMLTDAPSGPRTFATVRPPRYTAYDVKTPEWTTRLPWTYAPRTTGTMRPPRYTTPAEVETTPEPEPEGPFVSGCQGGQIPEEWREKILAFFNEHRQALVRGEIDKEGGGKLPRGNVNKMPKLKWDCQLEKEAEKAMENGTVKEDHPTYGVLAGIQGLSTFYVMPYEYETDVEEVLQGWWDAAGTMGNNKELDDEHFNRPFQNFATMAYNKVTKIGCTSRRSPRQCLAVNVCVLDAKIRFYQKIYE